MTVKTKIRCPACGVAIRVKLEHANKRGKCPACKEPFLIQLPDETAAATIQANPQAFAETIDLHISESDSNGVVDDDLPELAALGNLGRFRLLKQLGQGSFGRVYLAFDPQLDRQVALKVPTFEGHETRKIQRFVSEAKAAARLRHPNIVPTYESGQADGQYYIASQYIAGQTLAARLADNPPDFRQAAEWVRQLAEGLAYAHAQGIVHRDIKPANIMLDEHDAPQIMDFGLAKRLNDAAAMTIDGTVLGTPAYMPPEQARGDTAQVNAASDQYSLGVVLYELLTGERPFSGPSHAVIANVLTQEPPTPRDRRKEIPRDLDAICQVAMSKQQDRRYASAQEFAQDLNSWLNEAPIVARTASLVERFSRWRKREPRVAALITAVAVVLFFGVGISSLLAISAHRNLYLANLHAGKLNAALQSANAERERANSEADRANSEAARANTLFSRTSSEAARASSEASRAREAEIEAQDREAEALAARNDAIASRQLADERNVRLQGVLNELKRSQGDIATKTAELLAASESVTRAEESRAQSQLSAQLAAVRVALSGHDYAKARKQLDDCPPAIRNAEWNDLSKQTEQLAVKVIDKTLVRCRSITIENNNRLVALQENNNVHIVELPSGQLKTTLASATLLGISGGSVYVKRTDSIVVLGGKSEATYFVNNAKTAQSTAEALRVYMPIGATTDSGKLWIPRQGFGRDRANLGRSYGYIGVLELADGKCHLDPTKSAQVLGYYPVTTKYIRDFHRSMFLCWDSKDRAYVVEPDSKSQFRSIPQSHLDSRQPAQDGKCAFRNGWYVVSDSNRIEVYDSIKLVNTIQTPDVVTSVSVCPRGIFVAGVWNNSTLGIWRTKDGSLIRTYSSRDGKQITDFDFSKSGIAWVGGMGIEYWSLPPAVTQSEQ